jgi:two-component system response regulator
MSRSRIFLLVEDNPDDVELTLRAFARSGLGNETVVASTGQEALDYLFTEGAHAGRDPAVMPEVVFLDLNLPGLDGHEVLRRLRADPRTRRLPVVVLTSSREESDIARSYDLGANSFIRKPVDFVKFIEAIRQIGTYWLELNEPSPLAR